VARACFPATQFHESWSRSAAVRVGRHSTEMCENSSDAYFPGHRAPPAMTIVDLGPIWKVDLASMRMWIDFSHSLDP
jgi:hypothetical protein